MTYARDLREKISSAALGGGLLATGVSSSVLGGLEAKRRLGDSNFNLDEIDDVISTPGSILRGAGKTIGMGALGTTAGYGLTDLLIRNKLLGKSDSKSDKDLKDMGAIIGGGLGSLYGTYKSYSDEIDRANRAIIEKQLSKKPRSTRRKKKLKKKAHYPVYYDEKQASVQATKDFLGSAGRALKNTYDDTARQATNLYDYVNYDLPTRFLHQAERATGLDNEDTIDVLKSVYGNTMNAGFHGATPMQALATGAATGVAEVGGRNLRNNAIRNYNAVEAAGGPANNYWARLRHRFNKAMSPEAPGATLADVTEEAGYYIPEEVSTPLSIAGVESPLTYSALPGYLGIG